MPKARTAKDDTLELDFSGDDRKTKGSDADPIDAATGEPLFDDLSPRFNVRLDAAVEKVTGRKQAAEDEIDPSEDEEELDPTGDPIDDDEADEPEVDDDPDTDEPDLTEVEDEDADEPRPGAKPNKFEKRLARSDRLLEESRAQIAELQAREAARERRDQLAASTAEFEAFQAETDKKIKKLKADKVNAKDNGDSVAETEIDDQIVELRGQLLAKTEAHKTAKAELENASKQRKGSTIMAIKVDQWKRKNPRYETDLMFREAVNGIDRALAASGSNPETDEHYEKIDAELRKRGLIKAKVKTPPPRRHPSAQVTRESAPAGRRQAGDAKVQVRGNTIKISKAKLDRIKVNMAKFGLDPNNKEHLRDHILNNPGI